jgi:hypothetical protein
MRRDLTQLGSLQRELIELQSCLAVDTPPSCVQSWPGLQARLGAAAAAAARLRASAPIVGAAVAERRPGAGGGGLLAGLVGRQVSPADIEYMEQVSGA